ncbi:MAG: hypothetical protein PHV28_12400 [Kiritimatiellae bacterium]|nr:hypothetical protein [Kiritimatiellia bacterium]
MQFRNKATVLVGNFDAPAVLFRPQEGVLQKGERAGTSPVVREFSNEVVSGLRTREDSVLIVGDMVSRQNGMERALFVCAADDPTEMNPGRHTLDFTPKRGYDVRATGIGGNLSVERNAGGGVCLPVSSNEGVLIIFRPMP